MVIYSLFLAEKEFGSEYLSKNWVTSDHHFNHTNIIEYESRPFKSTTEMNEVMIANWNHVVKPGDIVYHLGDFAFKKKEEAAAIRERLNGYIVLVIGNHDGNKSRCWDIGFSEVWETLVLNDERYNLIMSHIPCFTDIPVINVSVDNWDFTPIPLPTTRFPLQLCGHSHGKWIIRGNTDERVQDE